jgi:hypothetical protein
VSQEKMQRWDILYLKSWLLLFFCVNLQTCRKDNTFVIALLIIYYEPF